MLACIPRLPVRPLPVNEAQILKLKLTSSLVRSMGNMLSVRSDDAMISILATDSALNKRIEGNFEKYIHAW